MNGRKRQAGNTLLLLLAAIATGAALCMSMVWPKVVEARSQAKEAVESAAQYSEAVRLSNASMAKTISALDQQQEKSNALESRLRRALSRSADCSLGGDVGSVLRDAVPADPGPSAADQGGAEAADPAVGGGAGTVEVDGRPVSCQAIAVWATRNIAIAKDNSLLLEEAVRQYELNRAARGQ